MNYIGFTGTQIGMTQAQRITFAMCLATLEPTALAHGDCIGSDEQAHEMALMARVPVWIFPPIDSSKRAWCQDAQHVGDPREYLERNRLIVDWCDTLIATPKHYIEELRSGTSTVRYARRLRGTNRKRVIVINPDGTTS